MTRASKISALLILISTLGWLVASTISSAGNDAIKLAWRVDTGKVINHPPLVIGNRVLVIPKGLPLTAYDKSNGAVKWTYAPTEGLWTRGMGSDGARAFVCLKGGDLAALDGKDGSLLWRIKLGINCQRQPHISDGSLYVSTALVGQGITTDTYSGAKLFSINPANGKINWVFTSENYLLQTAFQNSGIVYVGGSYINPEIVVDEGGPARFYALNSQTGQQKWIYESEDGLPKALYATKDRVVFVGYQDYVSGLDAANGKLVWRQGTGNWVPSVIGQGDVLYYGSANTRVHAWDTTDGMPRWEFNIPGGSFNYLLIKPVIVGPKMYFMSQRGTVFALNLEDGTELWSQPTGMDSRIGPSVSGDSLFMGDSSGTVYAYKILK
ncbi:MAG: PQQ-binding-like beta-propeller repeat protein [Rhodospirillaceae bacterium]|nr:PQQ-binding-like beta-propeller repeat protein [Rhodospirillaceae bacterium]MBL6931068.1 PQQ-binding-like beta-propeller repeat protein [Rhodospirillales bacterium]